MVRHHSKLQRTHWQTAFRSAAVQPHPAQPAAGRQKAGSEGAGGAAGGGGGGAAGGGGSKGSAGPVGQALTKKEHGESLDHSP
eukprot:2077653-Pyramimonas_sp.AAC.1